MTELPSADLHTCSSWETPAKQHIKYGSDLIGNVQITVKTYALHWNNDQALWTAGVWRGGKGRIHKWKLGGGGTSGADREMVPTYRLSAFRDEGVELTN